MSLFGSDKKLDLELFTDLIKLFVDHTRRCLLLSMYMSTGLFFITPAMRVNASKVETSRSQLKVCSHATDMQD